VALHGINDARFVIYSGGEFFIVGRLPSVKSSADYSIPRAEFSKKKKGA
jgi:hypothetical protein